MFRNKKVKNATITYYNGIKFRSKLEAECAKLLENNNVEYEYEPFKIELLKAFQYDGKTYRSWTYSPDFVIFKNIIIEVKGFENDLWGVKKKMILKYIVDNNYCYEFYEIRNTSQLQKLIDELKERELCKEN
jgi:hypothetical protein